MTFEDLLSKRAINTLARLEVYNLEQLKKLSYLDIYQLYNVGRKTIHEIDDFLADHGCHLLGDKSFIYNSAIKNKNRSTVIDRTQFESMNKELKELRVFRETILKHAVKVGLINVGS